MVLREVFLRGRCPRARQAICVGARQRMRASRPQTARDRQTILQRPASGTEPTLYVAACWWDPTGEAGEKWGHRHWLKRQGPLSVWMNSEWLQQEQGVARLAARSNRRTAERLSLFMGADRRPCGRHAHRLFGAQCSCRKTYYSLGGPIPPEP